MKSSVILFGLLTLGLLGCINPNGADQHGSDTTTSESGNAELESPARLPLYTDSGIRLLPAPSPDDPLSYEEIIWPWEMRMGDEDWGKKRRYAYSSMRYWSNDHPSASVTAICYTDYTDKGMPELFSAEFGKARRFEITTTDPAVLDNLKYFPETRELRIQSDAPLEDALTVLHYMSHLTRLEVWNQQHHQGKRVKVSEKSMRGMGSLQVLRFLRLYGLDIDDDGFRHLEGMKNVLYMELTNAHVTSKIFQTIATWPRIRYLKLYGLDFDQPLDPATARSLESLVGRIEILAMNPDDTESLPTRIHESLEAPFAKIWERSHLARQPKVESN